MVAALAIDDDKSPPVATRQHQVMLGKRGGERLPAVGALPAIVNGVADRLEVTAKAARLFELGAGGGFGFDVRAALVRHAGKAELLFECAAKILHLVFVEAWVDRGERLEVDPRPGNVHVALAAGPVMKRNRARLVGEAKLLFEALGEGQPQLAGELF